MGDVSTPRQLIINQMQNEIQGLQNKKGILLQKRMKAKEKTGEKQTVVIVTKQELRKQRNRQAAQKSRDRKRQFVQTLQKENNILRGIVNQCHSCLQQFESANLQREQQLKDEEQSILVNMTQTDQFIRVQSSNDQNSASGLSKYFWFTCLLIILCMANLRTEKASSNRQLVDLVSLQYFSSLEEKSIPTSVHSNLSVHQTSIAIARRQEINYCAKCLQCLKNQTSNSTLSLLGSEEQGKAINKTTGNILFCQSKVQFFSKIYESLGKEGENKEISRLLVKGKILKQMLKEDCFRGQEIKDEEQYAISFTVAIFEIQSLRKNTSRYILRHRNE